VFQSCTAYLAAGAIIQGRFLAKKGIWVSEYRVESGLNCGGHAFATDGFLLGPVLEEFRNSKEQLNRLERTLRKHYNPKPANEVKGRSVA